MEGQTHERRGEEVQNQGGGMGLTHLVVIEIIAEKGNVEEMLAEAVIVTVEKIEMEEIATERGIGLVIVIAMNVTEKIGTKIVTTEIVMMSLTGKEIFGDHVTETTTKIEIVREDMRGIVTGTTRTRIAQDIVKNGTDQGVIQTIITMMKLYKFSLFFTVIV